jgi:pyrrolidone-carboxylate peptidase
LKYILSFCFTLVLVSTLSNTVDAQDKVFLTTEEKRVVKAEKVMLANSRYFTDDTFKSAWSKVANYQAAKQLLANLGDDLWFFAKHQAQTGKIVDDRPLYWTRLALKSFIRKTPHSFSESQLIALLEVLETRSRGYSELEFSQKTDKRLLLTGFDPFLLDKNIKQSNPSGLTALLLDGVVIEYYQADKKITAEINTAMIPVRFEDFDQGEIESLLAPFYATDKVDMIATLSMGRSDFDLEHFPGLRRSATAPDNLNIFTGANKHNPLIPNLSAAPLNGKEFVEFSLPYKAMIKAKGSYKINDNRGVTFLTEGRAKDIIVSDISELADKTSVQGGGGGYLSNEISYRSIVLRDKLGSTIPTGHIHTPRISNFDPETNQAIVDQIKAMLVMSLTEI